MKVNLIAYTHTPMTICGRAAAKCTNSPSPVRALSTAMESGHESVAEHASFTFEIDGVSRVLLAQLTRHRLASYSVTSQRYIRLTELQVVVPESVKERGWEEAFTAQARAAFSLYSNMADDKVPIGDARYILPEGSTCSLVMTMNARELRHFFSLRCCHKAQWEIQELAGKMLTEACYAAPALFEDAGPGCVYDRCPEKRPCGHPYSAEVKP